MDWAGVLQGHEVALFDAPWAGRADAIFKPDADYEETWLYDMKTVRAAAMKYTESFPKEAHCLQLGAYATKLPHVTKGVIEYVDRGGSNPPIECVIDLEPWRDLALTRMAELEGALYRAELPEPLAPSLTAHYRKVRNEPYKGVTSITYDCDWRCSYCPFCHTQPPRNANEKFPPLRMDSPCQPAWHDSEEVAKKEKGAWRYLTTDERLRDEVERFIESIIPVVPIIGGRDEE